MTARDAHAPVGGPSFGDGQADQTKSGEGEAGGDGAAAAQAGEQVADDPDDRDGGDGGGQLSQSGLEGGHAHDELEMLGEEEHDADEGEDGDGVSGNGAAERRQPEQADIDKRLWQAALASHERPSRADAECDGGGHGPIESGADSVFHRKNDGHDRGDRQRR